MANLYYCDDLPASAFALGSSVEVAGDDGRHAVKVSRLRVGERILVGNGRGSLGEGTVTATDRDRFTVVLDEVVEAVPQTRRLILVQALAKGDRDERAVEQATEFGVDAVVPWQAARSVSRWDGAGGAEKAAKGAQKWQRIAREAAKQSLRPYVPAVQAPIDTAELCRIAAGPSTVAVLHPWGAAALSARTKMLAEASNDIYLVIGPEGGLSDAELEQLVAAGAETVVLGNEVLRTSSAGPAALAVLNVALGRW